MRALTGTGALIRLILRRDRIKLPLWLLGITGAMAANIPAVLEFYGTAEKQTVYASTTASSVVSRIFGGPIGGPNIGEIVMNETYLFTAVATAFMSTLLIIRHTRQNEETGRAELIRSAVVGGQASLTAALLVAVGANLILTGLMYLSFVANDLPRAGSLGASVALGTTGIVFAGVAAITAQLSESGRGANSLAAMGIGIAFLLRGIGDGLGRITPDGMGVVSAWPSWLSPLGWGEQMYPFMEGNWWIFGLFAALFVVLVGVAFALSAHRDVGLSIFPAKKGPARAKASLLSPFGLAWRLQRGTIRGWAAVMLVMGVTIGAVSKEFEKMFSDNEQIREFFGNTGSDAAVSDLLFSGMMAFLAIAIAAYVVQALLRMRSEESSGHLEPVLAAHVSRGGWLWSHIMCTLIGVAVLALLLGASSSITYVLITDGAWSEIPKLMTAILVHMPAVLVLVGLVTAVFGLLPSRAVALAWAAFAFCFFIGQFGTVLKLPSLVLDVSPFTHTPAAPLEPVTVLPLLLLVLVATGLTVLGFVAFRRRDLTTE